VRLPVNSSHSEILRASVSAEGLLLSADEPVLALQIEAGGVLGGPLLIPQLAGLARLAHRLKVVLSRPVVAAGYDVDVDLWVRAQPEGDGVQLAIMDWQERSARGRAIDAPGHQAALAGLEGGWLWQIDTQMRFVTATAGNGHGGPRDLPTPGMPLTAHFTLLPGPDGAMPILQAIAERLAFHGQRVVPVSRPGEEMLLAGHPVFDVIGRLTGFRGTAMAREAVEMPDDGARAVAGVAEPLPSYSALFGKRLDRALRQPLGRIIANADTISGQLEGPLREDYAAYAADIGIAGRHLMELVDDLADLQAIDRADFTVAREEVDLADIARRTAGLLAVKAADRHIRIDAPQTDEILPCIGEFRRALQIMVNLVGNALRYSPEGSMIWIRLERDGDMATVTIADQGRGIATEDQERIFDKFERLGREEAGGSGLGLYISRRLARAMGGDIKVESAPGQGARFLFTLPAAQRSQA
jgi:signal transduction histidine kinase